MTKTGRPKHGEVAKNAPLNMRTSPHLRAQLEQAAERSGRSLTLEVEARLRSSFIFDEVRGGQHINAFANILCATIQNIELDRGHRWMDDFDTFTMVRAAAERLLLWRNPGVKDNQLDSLEQAIEVADKALDDARAAIRKFAEEHSLQQRPSLNRGGLLGAVISESLPPNFVVDCLEGEARGEWSLLQRDLTEAQSATIAAKEALSAYQSEIFKRMEDFEGRGATIADVQFADLGPRG